MKIGSIAGFSVLLMLACTHAHAQQIHNKDQTDSELDAPAVPEVISEEDPPDEPSDQEIVQENRSIQESENVDVNALNRSAGSMDSSFNSNSSRRISGDVDDLSWLDNLKVGYDDGFVVANKEAIDLRADHLPFRLRINGWGQLRETTFAANDDSPDQNQFQLKRARLVLSGSTFTSDFSYFFQIDGRSSDGDDIRLLDYYLSYDVGHHRWGWERGTFGLNTGKYKMPFTLARFLSGKEFEFTDRSVASTFFDVNRSLAWSLFGRSNHWRVPVYWEAAVFNGLVTGGAETGSSGSLDNNFAYSARLAWYPKGEWGYGQLADFDYHRCLATRVGVAVVNSTIDRIGRTEFNTVRVVDSGATLASLLPDGVSEYTVNMFSFDASLKYRGWSFTSECYFRTIDGFQGADLQNLFDFGFWLQTGKFVVPGKFELLARWSRISGNSGTLGVSDQAADEIATGFAWYFREQHSKFTVDITKLDGAPINSSALDISPGDTGWLARAQIQFAF